MKRSTKSYALYNSTVWIVIMAVVGLCIGINFIISKSVNKPITREEAIAYSGAFDHYDTAWKNYRDLYFEDGSVYYVYPHTESMEFQNKMKSLEKGTMLHILVNPNTDNIIEIKTDTEELMNFEISQQEIYGYYTGYLVLGIFVCVGSVYLIWYAIVSHKHEKKERARRSESESNGGNTRPLRYAYMDEKSRVLLEATLKGYRICYRRVKSTNELVVNGYVYDKIKGIIEFEHKLCATVDGHDIEAGYDEESYSYISFDGKVVKRKKRWL